MKNLSVVQRYRLLFVLLLLITGVSCSEDDADMADSFVNITVDGTSSSYEITSAEYSYISRRFELKVQNGTTIMVLSIRSNNPNTITPGQLSTRCGVVVEVARGNAINATLLSAEEYHFDVTDVRQGDNNVRIAGNGTNIKVAPIFGGSSGSFDIDQIDINVTFTIPSKEELNFISFTANGEEYVYYGNNASGYFSRFFIPNPLPGDADLILTANVGNQDPRVVPYEGISIMYLNPFYPPTPKTFMGYSEGLRIVFSKPERSECIGSVVVYENRNNLEPDFNSSVMEVTDVQETDDQFIISGTFAGKITENSNDDVLTITNGKFRFSIKKLQ